MKKRASLKSAIARHKDNRMVKRKGKIFVINKLNPRFKTKQG